MTQDQRWRVLAAIAVAAVTIAHLSSLGRSLWWDEVYTAWAYVLQGPSTIRSSDAYIPNNHLLFSWLTWASSRATGMTEPALRLWAFVPGTAALVLLVMWTGRVIGWRIAAILAVLLAASPLHALMVTEARGYGLVLLSSAGLLIAGVQAVPEPSARRDLLLVTSGTLGVLTVPTLAIPAAITACAVLAIRRTAWMQLAGLGALGAGLTLWWYAPVIDSVRTRVTGVGARAGQPARPVDAIVGPAELLGAPMLTSGLPGPVPAIATLVALSLIVVGVWSVRRAHTALALSLAVVPTVAVLVLAAFGLHLLPRYLGFLLPSTTLAMALGIDQVLRHAGERWPVASQLGGVALAGLLFIGAATTLVENRVPRQDLRSVAELADRTQPHSTLVSSLDIGWTYYLRAHEPRVVEDERELDRLLCEAPGPVLYVEPTVAEAPTLPCLAAAGFRAHRFEQRSAPGQLTAWVRP
ncbi:MAG: hypothetical protein JJT89_01300 [Nitriliruptoraceae bacterium]|nr:hypothetical protein [Nitriliruptoraceae bacterium]